MKKKLIAILSLFLIIHILSIVSCIDCGPFPDKYKVKGLNFSVVKVENLNFESEIPILHETIENDTISYENFGINISPIINHYFSLNYNVSFNLIKSAYACSPTKPTTDETIENIKIISHISFDEDHKENSDISEYFDIITLDIEGGQSLKKYNLLQYLSKKPEISETEFTLILNTQPKEKNLFSFTIKYYQNGIDNDYFEYETGNYFINN